MLPGNRAIFVACVPALWLKAAEHDDNVSEDYAPPSAETTKTPIGSSSNPILCNSDEEEATNSTSPQFDEPPPTNSGLSISSCYDLSLDDEL